MNGPRPMFSIRVILLSQTTIFPPPYFPVYPPLSLALNYVKLNTLALGLYTLFVSFLELPSGSQLSWFSANKGDCRHFGLPVHAELTSLKFQHASLLQRRLLPDCHGHSHPPSLIRIIPEVARQDPRWKYFPVDQLAQRQRRESRSSSE